MWATLMLVAAVAIPGAFAASSNQLPANYPRCKQSDPQLDKCLKSATQTVLSLIKSGVPTLSVPSIDPLKVTAIEIGQGSGPIALNMKFTDITVKGLGDSKISSLKSDLKGYSLLFDGEIEKAIFESDYEMSGRILLLPVTGKGRCKLIFDNLQARLGPKGKGTTKKGKLHFDVVNFPIEIYQLGKLEVHFDNLFNGDKTLGESMNKLLNENWKDLWSELRPAFAESFQQIFLQYSKQIFDKVAFNDIFLE